MPKFIIMEEPKRVKAFVAAKLGVSPFHDGTAIGLEDEHCHLVAGVIFEGYNRRSVQMHVAAESGAKWLSRQFLAICFAYPFTQLGVSKIIGLVGEGNWPARRFDEHLGFVLEATLEDAHPDGKLLIYSMTRAQCRWLNIPLKVPHGKEFRSTAS